MDERDPDREDLDLRVADDAEVRRVPARDLEGIAPAEDEIRIPIVEEELVVGKRVVVREVLVIRKRVVSETREVEAELRKERIEVERAPSDDDGQR